MSFRTAILTAALALAACSSEQLSAPAGEATLHHGRRGATGAVFVSTNDGIANAVVAFDRAADGTLTPAGTFPTGGAGFAGPVDPLQSQFALVLSPNRRFLFVVNAGTNDVSSFAVDKGRLRLVDRQSSGGARPVSVAASDDAIYVLNTVSNTIGVLKVRHDGRLRGAGTAALSAGAAGAAAIRLSRDGGFLSVTERGSNTIDTWVVRRDGALGELTTTASAGQVPFGFDYDNRRRIVVSEAASRSASSYLQHRDGSLTVVSAAVPVGQAAPCWVIVDPAGRFAYTANAGSASITGFAIAADGALSHLTPGGLTGDLGTGAQPLDLDMSRDGRFLYVLENGTGNIGWFAVRRDGTLESRPDVPGLEARDGYMGVAAF